jgi:hypothetical protein
VSEDVQRIQPDDPEITETWLRETDEPDVRAVEASRISSGWQVGVWVMEFIRADPLETELRQRMATALRGVSGVTGAEEEDRETWLVTGTPSGRALAEAAAEVVDDLADRTRACVNGLPG